ncbi:P-loop containing nucleoside triphosphate hydrolase protein [Multifurca ochricompacta]|uniref:P-loop containing nucleoside triphosphate hydrolase protein n=1 Tax=Multifurca ochricompacta TaxID=376703 RepID=A0AAD4QML2_9AGAM|nr:P-loop containing nucleoside triphosphate hydrolase protein [Multifurca ochricompacta]
MAGPRLTQAKRFFVASSVFRHPSSHPLPSSSSSSSSTSTPSTPSPPESSPRSIPILSRFLPASLSPDADGSSTSTSSTSASFRKIVALARPERRPLLTAIGLLMISSSVSLSIPFTVGKLIDYFTSSNPTIPYGLSLTQATAGLLLVFTIGGACNAGRAFLMRMSGQRIVARLRERTYAATLRQEVEFVERGEGDALSRLSVDSSIVGESVTQNLSDGLRAVVMSFAGLGAMLYISSHLTFLMLAIVPPISLGAVFYGRYIKRLSHKTQEALGDMTKVAQESLAALRTVQVFNAAPYEEQKFSERVSRVLTLARREAVASGIFFGSTGWSGNVALLALLGYGGSLVSRGQISVGELTSLLMYTVYVGSGLQMLTSFFTSIMRGIGAGTRIFELLDRTSAIRPGVGVALDPTRSGTLKFENITFSYPTRRGVNVLEDFNLEVNVGENVAIVGKSGGGKSSVHSLLLRYYDPVRGKVTFDGQDIREFTPESWRNIIGVVPQDPVLFTGTIASNIAYGNESATREQIEAAAREANCEFVWGLPDGFDTQIGRLSLSGGQRQRLAIARALLKKPAILALDEATSSLDASAERRVNDAIDKILRSRHTTCLFVAHRLSTIARAERIVVLEDGHITETGTYRELVQRDNSRFRTLMAAQLNTAGEEHVSAVNGSDTNIQHGVEEQHSESKRADGMPLMNGELRTQRDGVNAGVGAGAGPSAP